MRTAVGNISAAEINELAEMILRIRSTLQRGEDMSEEGEVTITTNDSGQCVAVTRTDSEHRILKVLWEGPAVASGEAVPFDKHEAEVCKVMDERDRAEDMADKLAQAIASLVGVDVGEHSSGNCPWQSALDAAEDYEHRVNKPAAAPPQPAQAPAEPVAWRYTAKLVRGIKHVTDQPPDRVADVDLYNVEPLYLNPAPPARAAVVGAFEPVGFASDEQLTLVAHGYFGAFTNRKIGDDTVELFARKDTLEDWT